MHLLSTTVRRLALAVLALPLLGAAAHASDNKIAVVPGGPHPYFASWPTAAADAAKAFGIADVEDKVPSDWRSSKPAGPNCSKASRHRASRVLAFSRAIRSASIRR